MPDDAGDAAGDASRRTRFDALAGEVLEPLRRYLARRADPATADDVLSDVLLVLWRRLDDVPPAASGEALPWSYGVARGCLANAARGARRRVRLAERVASTDPPRWAVGPGEEGGDPEPVRAALAVLRPPSAEVLRLWAWEQLAPAEIAVVLGVTANAVSIRLHRAKKELAAELERARRKDDAAAGHPGTRGRGTT